MSNEALFPAEYGPFATMRLQLASGSPRAESQVDAPHAFPSYVGRGDGRPPASLVSAQLSCRCSAIDT